MKVFRMRQKLHLHGLVLLQHGRGFKVTDQGVKTPFEKDFPNLAAVQAWYKDTFKNRLNEAEAAEWDDDYETFVETGEWPK